MKDLLKIAIFLAIAFASTFLILQSSGLVTEAGVTAWLDRARDINPLWLIALIIALLLLDLFIAVPTMTTILLAGFLLGPWIGGADSALGLMLPGMTGYGLGQRYGRRVLIRVYKVQSRLSEIERAFAQNDLLTLFVCQALPILPELSCTLAGIARMRVRRFLFGYAVGVVPCAFIVAYDRSKSTLADPSPAIYTAVGSSAALLIAWALLKRRAGSAS